MDKNKLNLYGIIICVALLILAAGIIISQDTKIHNLNIQGKMYEKRQEQIAAERDSLLAAYYKQEKQIERLQKELTNIPTDAEITNERPIIYVTYDDVWRTITQPIEEAINFSERERSVVPN